MPLAIVTITDKKDLLGRGVYSQIDLRVAYTAYKASKATWGYQGGDPGEPERIEIGHIEVIDAPQSLEADIIEFFSDDIENDIMSQLSEASQAEPPEQDDDYSW